MTNNKLNESFDSNILKKFIAFSQDYAKKNNKYYEIRWVWAAQSFDMFNIKYDGTVLKGTYRPALSDLSDDNIVSGKFYEGSDLFRVLKGRKAMYNSMKQMTVGKQFSFLILIDWEEVKRDKDAEVIAAMIIEPKGTKEIYDASQRGIKRKEDKVIKINNDPNVAKTAYWKDTYKKIRSAYDKYKKENGDKAALELADAVKTLVNNQDCINTLNKMFDTRFDKETATKYLYLFLLGYKEPWLRRPFEKDERFMRLYKKFNKEEQE